VSSGTGHPFILHPTINLVRTFGELDKRSEKPASIAGHHRLVSVIGLNLHHLPSHLLKLLV
jgi:hypothetical protein